MKALSETSNKHFNSAVRHYMASRAWAK